MILAMCHAVKQVLLQAGQDSIEGATGAMAAQRSLHGVFLVMKTTNFCNGLQ